MLRYYFFALIFPAIVLCGCDQKKLMESLVPKEDISVAQQYMEFLRTHNFQAIKNDLDPSLLNDPSLDEDMAHTASFLPEDEPLSSKVVGFHVQKSAEGTDRHVTLEYHFPDRRILANVATRTSPSGLAVIGLEVNVLPDSLENIHRFTFSNKPPVCYAVLPFLLLIPLLIFYTLVKCILDKPRRRWLWVLFIIFGIGSLSVNWTTTEPSFDLLSFQLFGAGVFSELYGPWVFSVSLPVGAVVYLLYRRKKIGHERIDLTPSSGHSA